MSDSLDRRQFLSASLVATALPALSISAAEVPSKPVIPIVDTHQHLWDLSKFRLPWHAQEKSLAKSYVMSDYLEATKGLNVVKAVYMEVDVEPSQQPAEADYVIDIIDRKAGPTVAAVISGRPASDGFTGYITKYKKSPHIKGVRQVLHGGSTPAGYCLDKNFVKGIQFLGELGLSFDLCMRPGELPDVGKLIDACPDTRFILDHCGNAKVGMDLTQWKMDMDALAKRQRLVCKVSGIIASAKPGQWKNDDLAPIINHTLDTFGPDRVMFGGDWPVCTLGATYSQWVTALKEMVASRPMEQQRKLFSENAVRYYKLS